jgi:diguanylate cyclase (GGDEF)-like protein/PAS domain S-box-containing protein
MDRATLTLLLVDDDPTNVSRIRRMTDAQHAPRFELIHAPDLQKATKILGLRHCDIVLLNFSRSDPAPLGSYAVLAAHAPATPVLILAPAECENLALKAVQRGAADYLLHEMLYDTVLVRAVRHAVERQQAEEQRRAAEEALRASESRYRALYEQSRDAILITDADLRILEANPATMALLGYEPAQLYGMRLGDLLADAVDGDGLEALLAQAGGTPEAEVRLARRDGAVVWCLLSAAARADERGMVWGYQGILHDITDRKRAEEQLIHDAFHDGLTGLPNRALFADRLDAALARWRRHPLHRLAVLFIDLDRFKVVNDSLGHSIGDAFLRRIAAAIREAVREADSVARLGGDEFAILIENIAGEADALSTAERVQAALANCFDIDGHRMFTSGSIGIALPESPLETADDVLRNADIAMYRAKRRGPAHYEVYASSMHSSAVDLHQLETDLRLAVPRDEFVLHYQPIVDIASRRVVGYEALVRWQHPVRGLLLPHHFIGLAEETGLIVPLGVATLRQACRHAATLARDAMDKVPYMAVNVSGRHLVLPTFVDDVLGALRYADLPPHMLALEITESAMIVNATAAGVGLRRLRELGVRVCIDDFGTGYSSLSYLHALPIDGIKVDRSFITKLEAGSERMQVVQAIADLGRRLGMTVVAEGVETTAQLRQVEELGLTTAQGFLFARPQAAGIPVGLGFPEPGAYFDHGSVH